MGFLNCILVTLIAFSGAVTRPAQAEPAFPSQPIRLMVPLAAGGPTDAVARAIGDKMSASLGVPVVVENRAGAGGQIALEATLRAAPDGHTLLVATSGHPLLPFSNKGFNVDMTRELTGIAHFFSGSVAFASSATVPVTTMAEFIAYARANPGKLNYAGQGISDVFGNELLKSMTGIQAETVRYKGGAPAVLALLTGESHYTFASPGAIRSHVETGKIRLLATTGLQRSAALPDTPTIAESVAPGFEYVFWVGLAAPAKTPAGAISRLHGAAAQAIQHGDVQSRLKTLGYEAAAPAGPEAVMRIMAADIANWRRVAEVSGIKPE